MREEMFDDEIPPSAEHRMAERVSEVRHLLLNNPVHFAAIKSALESNAERFAPKIHEKNDFFTLKADRLLNKAIRKVLTAQTTMGVHYENDALLDKALSTFQDMASNKMASVQQL